MASAGDDLQSWLARLESYSPFEIELGLDRVWTVLDRLDLLLPDLVIHVGGTNGKGSSVTMLDGLLRESGIRCGAYTSPHIHHYNERIRINGVTLPDADIVASFERVAEARADTPLTYFEFGTLAALVAFTDAGVDACVLEVGLGGRLDAVNAIEPSASLITNVSLDHCDWLGNSIEEIATEKSGIMRAEKPTVFASADVPRAIRNSAEQLGADLRIAGQHYQWTQTDRNRWNWAGTARHCESLALPALAGDYQMQNAAGCLALLESIDRLDVLSDRQIGTVLSSISIAGRMQSHDGWLFDVAHNPAAAEALGRFLSDDHNDSQTIAIIGMLDDKDVEGVITPLLPSVRHWIATTPDSPRAIPALELSRRIANLSDRPCLVCDDAQQAVDEAQRLKRDHGRILVTGSFFAVGPVQRVLGL